jgi:hypothetical protein
MADINVSTPRGRSMLQMLDEIHKQEATGAEAAAFAAEVNQLTGPQFASLRDGAKLNDAARKLVIEIEQASEAVLTDPYARREWLRSQILGLQAIDRELLDPQVVLRLCFDATALKLKNGDTALPLFQPKPFSERKNWTTTLAFPNVSKLPDGVFQTRGARMMVPSTPDDLQALDTLRSVWGSMQDRLVDLLERETLVDIREFVWMGLFFLSYTSINAPWVVKRLFDKSPTDEFTLVSKDKGQQFVYYPLSKTEVFTAKKTALSDRFVYLLRQHDLYTQQFWAGEIDVSQEIEEMVAREESGLLTATEFLQGKYSGRLEVRHDTWYANKGSDRTVKVHAVFERSSEGLWRWVRCNRAGVFSLFGGTRLMHHSFTS